jgi:hypothetical protein
MISPRACVYIYIYIVYTVFLHMYEYIKLLVAHPKYTHETNSVRQTCKRKQNLRLWHRWLWREVSRGIYRRAVRWKWTHISEEHTAFFFKRPAFTLVSCSAYSTPKMEAICSSETSIDFQRTTRRYIPGYSTLQICKRLQIKQQPDKKWR